MKTCETCQHYSGLTQQCREDSKKVFMVVHPQQGPVFLSVWPNVEKDDWCARHKAEEVKLLS